MSAVTKLFGRWSGCRGTSRVPQPVSTGVTARLLVLALLPLAVLTAGVTAGCGGGGELSIERPVGEAEEETELLELSFPTGQPTEYRLPFRISGGFQPYERSLDGCPEWVTLLSDQGVLAGTRPVEYRDRSLTCTYRVTEADPGFRPQRSVNWALHLVDGARSSLTLPQPDDIGTSVGTFFSDDLPSASGGIQPHTYSFTCAGGQLPSGMGFAPETRIFAGTPESAFRDSCTYTVTDSAEPAQTVSRAIEVEVTSPATPKLTLGDPDDISISVGELYNEALPEAKGGVLPHTYSFACGGGELPPGMSFTPETRRFAGTPDAPFRDSCTYSAKDSAESAQTVSWVVEIEVTPLDRGTWRFRTRTVEPGGPCALRSAGISTPVAILPHAQGGEAGEDVYNLIDFPEDHFLSFDPDTRRLTYTHPSADPIVGTPNTYRYLAGTEQSVNAANADDALCLDIRYNPGPSAMCGDPDADPAIDPDYFIHIQLQVRDDAFWDENAREYRCPDSTAPEPRSDAQSVSNPVHTALAPVHARRAADVAHSAVRDRVRSWSPGGQGVLTAIAPAVGLASLSGESGGFDYSGTSESLSAGAELGAGAWQAGVLASVAWTELHYRAGASLAERGYRSGEHDTEFLSLHPFAAWHASSGGHVWASVGAGTGELRHRDDLGFPSWSRSDARLLTSAVGGSLPLAEVFYGELQAEAGIETFALEIEGGGRISSSLPTMRGRDYRAGLAWSAPVAGAPSLSMGYKHLTGVGADGGSLETQGSFSLAGVFDPRLSLTGSVEASFGIGENEQNLWGLGAGLRFAPDGLGRGFGLEVDSRLMPSADEQSSDLSIQGEAGYGLGGGPFGTIRPYAGLIGDSRHRLVQQTLGLALRETPNTAARIEFRERPAIDRALMFTLWHRL